MKKLKNKETNIEGPEGKVTYSNLIETVLNAPKQGGLNYDEMVNRYRIEDACKKANGTIDLEDSDVGNLKRLVKAMTWGAKHRDLIAFHEDVENL